MAAFFYHLTDSPLEVALPMLLIRARQRDWRILVRGQDKSQLEWLGQQLWLTKVDEFLAHGLSGGPFDADQPVLLTSGAGNGNAAQCLMAVDGAEVTADDGAAFERVCILFDGADAQAVEHARGQWKTLVGAGMEAEYWAQDQDNHGRWSRKATSTAKEAASGSE